MKCSIMKRIEKMLCEASKSRKNIFYLISREQVGQENFAISLFPPVFKEISRKNKKGK